MEKMRPNPEGHLTGLGDFQHVTPDRQIQGRDRLTADAEYAEKAGVHLWLVILTHKASDALLDSTDGTSPDSMPILDVDTMLGPPTIACFVCEAAYEPRLRRRKCPGQPRD